MKGHFAIISHFRTVHRLASNTDRGGASPVSRSRSRSSTNSSSASGRGRGPQVCVEQQVCVDFRPAVAALPYPTTLPFRPAAALLPCPALPCPALPCPALLLPCCPAALLPCPAALPCCCPAALLPCPAALPYHPSHFTLLHVSANDGAREADQAPPHDPTLQCSHHIPPLSHLPLPAACDTQRRRRCRRSSRCPWTRPSAC